MRRTVPLLAALLSLAPYAAPAQWAGQRVRLTTTSEPARWLAGTLVRQDADSLRLQVPSQAAPIAVARSAVVRLEISGGQRRFTGPGAVHGLEFGALAGAVVALRGAAAPCARLTTAAVCGELRTLAGAAVGGAVGATVGAAIGSLFKTERWDAASPAPLQVAFAPRGAVLALSLRF
jgi:hypothetical protein